MYESFYGLKEKPFNVTPDARLFYPTEQHTEALDSLLYAINERKGFAVVTGEVGSGKTTVWHTLLKRLDPGTRVAIITNSNLTPKQMLMAILEDLQIPFKDRWTKVKLHSAFYKFLIEQATLGFNVVVLIDEAQNLKFEVLEEVRMLSNLETDAEKLLQIILMGQPELRDLLSYPELRQLKQRVSVYYHLSPLEKAEAYGYIEHRLKLTSVNGVVKPFDDNAIEKIYHYAQGIPRLINMICDRGLLTGYIRDTGNINAEIIDEVAGELELTVPEASLA